MVKTCRTCGVTKGLSQFPTDSTRPDCQVCRRALTANRVRRHQRRNADPRGLTCLICGEGPFVKVSTHAAMRHGVDAREYRRRFPGTRTSPEYLREAWNLELLERGRPHGSRKQRRCKRGHSLRGRNLYWRSNGTRECLACRGIRRGENTCTDCGAGISGQSRRCRSCAARHAGNGTRLSTARRDALASGRDWRWAT